MCLFERPDLARPAGAVLGTEEFVFDTIGNHRRRVEDDEWTIGAQRFLVEDARGEFLAGSRRAAQHDAAVGRRRLVDVVLAAD